MCAARKALTRRPSHLSHIVEIVTPQCRDVNRALHTATCRSTKSDLQRIVELRVATYVCDSETNLCIVVAMLPSALQLFAEMEVDLV